VFDLSLINRSLIITEPTTGASSRGTSAFKVQAQNRPGSATRDEFLFRPGHGETKLQGGGGRRRARGPGRAPIWGPKNGPHKNLVPRSADSTRRITGTAGIRCLKQASSVFHQDSARNSDQPSTSCCASTAHRAQWPPKRGRGRGWGLTPPPSLSVLGTCRFKVHAFC
jgi:hypothetical protein